MKKILFILVVLSALVLSGCAKQKTLLGGDKDEHGCIASAGYTWDEAKQKCVRPWEENKTNENLVVGNDKDEHGCIASAGYTWDEAKQKCVRPWEENKTDEN